MDDVVLSVIVGGGITLLTELAKKVKIPIDAALVVLCVVAGCCYYLFTAFLPMNLQTNVVNFVVGSLGFATVFYRWILKVLKPDVK